MWKIRSAEVRVVVGLFEFGEGLLLFLTFATVINKMWLEFANMRQFEILTVIYYHCSRGLQ